MSYRNQSTTPDRKQPTNKVSCTLLDISEFYALGRVPPSWVSDQAITLYTNPQAIQRALTANYGKVNGLLTTLPNISYGNSDREPIKISGSLIDTGCIGYDATPYLDKLEKLTLPSINSSPPVLAIVWGARVIQPVVITNLSINETAWSNGLVSRAELDLTFQYLPGISYRASNDENRVKALTEREQKKAKELGAKKLDVENKGSKKPIKPTDPKSLKVSSNGEVIGKNGKVILTTDRRSLMQ